MKTAVAPCLEGELQRRVGVVWRRLLGLEVRRAATREAAGPGVLARVRVDGASTAELFLAVPLGLARRAAALMFGTRAECLDLEDVEDALGELASILGGGLRAVLEAPLRVSSPTAVMADDGWDVGRPVGWMSFECEGQVFCAAVRIWRSRL